MFQGGAEELVKSDTSTVTRSGENATQLSRDPVAGVDVAAGQSLRASDTRHSSGPEITISSPYGANASPGNGWPRAMPGSTEVSPTLTTATPAPRAAATRLPSSK